MRAVDAVAVESSAHHRPGRDCPCGPVAMRDLATGCVSVWRHRSPSTSIPPPRGTSLLGAMDRHDQDAADREHRSREMSAAGHVRGVLIPQEEPTR